MKRLILLFCVLLAGVIPLRAAYDGKQSMTKASVSEQMLFNCRVYDPQTGRFLSTDPVVQFPNDLQSYNRYSYVRNNPLRTNDPTGYYEPEWLVRDVLTLRQATTPAESASIASMKSTAALEVGAGVVDSTVSLGTGPLAITTGGLFTSMTSAMGEDPLTPSDITGSSGETGTGLGSSIMQGGRDLVTNLTGVSDSNEGRNAAEASTNIITTVAAAGLGLSEGLSRLESSAVRTGLSDALPATAKGSATTGGGLADVSAATPVGRSGKPLSVVTSGDIPSNTPGSVMGREYTGHAFDSMQGRGIPPSAVENTIQTGAVSDGNLPGRVVHYDSINNTTVVTGKTSGRVITVHEGKP